MAQTYSFDIVSEVSMQETDNAVNQAIKEIGSRYDLRGSNAEVVFDSKLKTISIRAEGEHFVEAVREIIQQKCLKRGISALSLDAGKPEAFGGKTIRMTIKIKDGMEQDEAKKIKHHKEVFLPSFVHFSSFIFCSVAFITNKNKFIFFIFCE